MTAKELRALTGLTQAQFAKAINTSKRNVENWEMGLSNPAPSTKCMLEYLVLHCPDFWTRKELNEK